MRFTRNLSHDLKGKRETYFLSSFGKPRQKAVIKPKSMPEPVSLFVETNARDDHTIDLSQFRFSSPRRDRFQDTKNAGL